MGGWVSLCLMRPVRCDHAVPGGRGSRWLRRTQWSPFYCWKKGRGWSKEKARHTMEVDCVEARRGSITTTTHRTPPTLESVHWSGVCVDLLEGERETCKPALGAFLTPGGGTVINVHESSLVSPTAFFTFFKSWFEWTTTISQRCSMKVNSNECKPSNQWMQVMYCDIDICTLVWRMDPPCEDSKVHSQRGNIWLQQLLTTRDTDLQILIFLLRLKSVQIRLQQIVEPTFLSLLTQLWKQCKVLSPTFPLISQHSPVTDPPPPHPNVFV